MTRRFFCLLKNINMETFAQRQQQAESTINLLKQQLTLLTKIAEQKQRLREKDEIEQLRRENNTLQGNVRNLKFELQFHETQNGVKQIAVKSFNKELTVETPANPEPEKPTETPKPKDAKKTKEGKKKEKTPAVKNSGTPEKPIDISRLSMKVGKITDAKKHPDADGLFIETVEFGEERPRIIISGLVNHYTVNEMKNRLAIFMCNLKPQKMRGILSEGMIMCASTPEKVEILEVPEGAQIGDKVQCSDYKGEADGQLNPKRKIWEQIQPELLVNADGIPTYKGSPFEIEGKGTCKAPTMKDCPIK